MPIKILMLLDNPFKSDARVEKEAISLVKAGYSVTIFAVEDDAMPHEEFRDGYTIKRVFSWLFNSPLKKGFNDYISAVVNTIAKEDFQVLHCHDFYMLYIGMIVKQKKPNIKLLYDAHEYLVGWPFYLSNKGLLNKIKGYLVWHKLIANEKKAIREADAVITITTSIADRLQRNNGLAQMPLVVSNYPNHFEVTTNKNYFRALYGISNEQLVLVHSGTIYHTDQQLRFLFNVVRNNEKIALVFIGNKPRFEEVKSLVNADSRLQNRIFFHPYLSNQKEMVNLLSCADIGLMHIRDTWEAHKIGFSNRFVEYALAEIPVIATPQDFTKTVNETFPCSVFYAEDNEKALDTAVKTMLQNYQTLKSGIGAAKENFNWRSEEVKLLDIYTQLLR